MSRDSYSAIPDFGRLYDAVPFYNARKDIAFYVDEAKRASGPVLEIGCGTGRVLIPTARAGTPIAGLDPSPSMLARCEEKLAAEPADARARVKLHAGDARTFSVTQRFALITAPFRSFQHCTTIDDQLAYIAGAVRHLAPGGRFIFDCFNPRFEYLTRDRTEETVDTPEFEMPDGRRMRRTSRIPRVRWADQVNESELIYYVTPAGSQTAQRYVQAFEMRWVLRDELVHLIARSGLRITAIYGDFDRSPLVDGAPEIIVVAER